MRELPPHDDVDRRNTSVFSGARAIHNGYPVAYFEGRAGLRCRDAVVEAMNDYLYHHNANTHWAYPTSEETDAIIDCCPRRAGRISERQPDRDRVWRQHDDLDLSSRARAGPRI